MASRCYIGKWDTVTQKFKGIYCHTSENIEKVLPSWKSTSKIDELLNFGYISELLNYPMVENKGNVYDVTKKYKDNGNDDFENTWFLIPLSLAEREVSNVYFLSNKQWKVLHSGLVKTLNGTCVKPVKTTRKAKSSSAKKTVRRVKRA